jgi:hypothetical protein
MEPVHLFLSKPVIPVLNLKLVHPGMGQYLAYIDVVMVLLDKLHICENGSAVIKGRIRAVHFRRLVHVVLPGCLLLARPLQDH